VVAKIGHSDRINKLISKRLRTILLKQIYFLHEEFERMLHNNLESYLNLAWYKVKYKMETFSQNLTYFLITVQIYRI